VKFIELFAGIGGFRLGLELAGHQCVWANEWLEKPRRIYARNFGEQPDSRDIRTIRAEDLPEADFICGGFPCATFSVAGKRSGFSLEDTRGTLAFEMFRLARDRGIPYIFFENVEGLLSHDGGATFGIILEVLDAMGYDSQWELLDSQNFGVPQHRERIFLIANLRGKPRPKVFPIGIASCETYGKSREENQETKGRFRNGSLERHSQVMQWRRSYMRECNKDIIPTLTANMGTGGNNVPYISFEKQVMAVSSPDIKVKNQNGRRYKDHDEPCFTLTAQDRHGVIIKEVQSKLGFIKSDEPMAWDIYNKRTRSIVPTLTTPNHNSIRLTEKMKVRKLTPLECERLQGLPDNFTKWLKMDDGSLKQASDSERYERCGRTVTIPVIETIGRRFGYEWY